MFFAMTIYIKRFNNQDDYKETKDCI